MLQLKYIYEGGRKLFEDHVVSNVANVKMTHKLGKVSHSPRARSTAKAWPDLPSDEIESVVHAMAQFLAGLEVSTFLWGRPWIDLAMGQIDLFATCFIEMKTTTLL